MFLKTHPLEPQVRIAVREVMVPAFELKIGDFIDAEFPKDMAFLALRDAPFRARAGAAG